jgi:hypothetical protein
VSPTSGVVDADVQTPIVYARKTREAVSVVVRKDEHGRKRREKRDEAARGEDDKTCHLLY